MNAEFNLVTRCSFQAPAKAVWDATVRVSEYPEWWPSIKSVIIQGNETTLQEGSDVRYTIQGFLPHTLQFQTRVTRCLPCARIEMLASGDLQGHGLSLLEEHEGITQATFQWNVILTPPLLNRFSKCRLFRKLFVWNHDWAMRYAIRNMQKRVYDAVA